MKKEQPIRYLTMSKMISRRIYDEVLLSLVKNGMLVTNMMGLTPHFETQKQHKPSLDYSTQSGSSEDNKQFIYMDGAITRKSYNRT